MSWVDRIREQRPELTANDGVSKEDEHCNVATAQPPEPNAIEQSNMNRLWTERIKLYEHDADFAMHCAKTALGIALDIGGDREVRRRFAERHEEHLLDFIDPRVRSR